MKIKDIGLRVVYVIAVIGVWEALVRLTHTPDYILPTPSAITEAMTQHFWYLLGHTQVTFVEVLGGFFLAVVTGIFTAILIFYSKFLRATLYPTLVTFQSIPRVAIAPLFVIWFGLGITSKLVMALLLAYFPIVVNTASGIGDIHPDLIHLMRAMSATGVQTFLKVRLPHAVPYILDGMKIGLPLAVVGAIIGEFVGANAGLGNVIIICGFMMETPLVFAALVFITVISLVLYGAVVLAEKKLLKWRP